MNTRASLAFVTMLSALAGSAFSALSGCSGSGDDPGTGGHESTTSTSSAGGSGGGGGAGGSGGGFEACVAEAPKLVLTKAPGEWIDALDIGAAGFAVVIDDDSGARVMTFASDGAPIAQHALKKQWGQGVSVSEAGTLALVSVTGSDGAAHYEAALVSPTGELVSNLVTVSPLKDQDAQGTSFGVHAIGGQVAFVGDRFLVVWWNESLVTGDTLSARYVGLDGKPIGPAFIVDHQQFYHFAMTVDATGVIILETGVDAQVLARLPAGSTAAELIELNDDRLSSNPSIASDGKGNLLLASDGKALNNLSVIPYQGSAGVAKEMPFQVGPMGYLRGDRYAMLLDTYPVSGRHLFIVDSSGNVLSDSVISGASADSSWEVYTHGDTIRSVWSTTAGEVWMQTDCAPAPAMP